MDAKHVSLREIGPSVYDIHKLLEWRNHPDTARWFPAQPPWDAASVYTWYHESYATDPSQNLYFVLLDQVPIGTVGMTIKGGKGELERMMLGNKLLARGGYMRQGMNQLMDAYGLDHYWLRVMPDNEATIAFHKKNGFKVTGTHGGRYVNTLHEAGEYLVMERYGEAPWNHLSEARCRCGHSVTAHGRVSGPQEGCFTCGCWGFEAV